MNVSVNIKQAEAIAAGMLTVGYNSNFAFQGAERGQVFEEMQFVNENGQVRCVGNVADIRNNAANPNDVYVNLRFKATNTGDYSFSISAVDFCDTAEKDVTAISIQDVPVHLG